MPKYVDVDKLKLEPDENGVLNGVLVVGGRSGKRMATVMGALKHMIQNAPAEAVELVVHCQDCTCKKAVSIGRVMVWRCPYSTVDVDLDGYCHRGVKRNEGLGRS